MGGQRKVVRGVLDKSGSGERLCTYDVTEDRQLSQKHLPASASAGLPCWQQGRVLYTSIEHSNAVGEDV